MANRRMFAKSITNSSRFLMMPSSAQSLYFHLGMNADDDGYCEHFTLMRMTGSNPDDLKVLATKHFVEVFDDHVLVITDWSENNQLRKDRYIPSKYIEIYKRLPDGKPLVAKSVTQCSVVKVSIGNDKEPKAAAAIKVLKPPKEVCAEIISYLNDKAGRKFDVDNEEHYKIIRLRWKKYPDIAKFKFVIDACCGKWKDDDKMRDYLQPSTLFNGKFGEKLGWTLQSAVDHRTTMQIKQDMEDARAKQARP